MTLSHDIRVSGKPPKGGKKGADGKRSKKSKKKKKEGRGETEGKGARRAVHRTRSDSYTTSSDEERWLEGRREAGRRDGGEGREAVDEEQVKAKLERRIQSRKPPSLFETPATDPIFHQVRHRAQASAYNIVAYMYGHSSASSGSIKS